MFYGQNKEDEIINDLIVSKYGSDFKGTILDLGANDGITLSNSRYFIENGWKGVLIEAGKSPYEKLMTTVLPNTIAINCAVGNQDGFLTFYESNNLLNSDDIGLVSSLVADETQRWRKAGIGFTEYQVECFTWESFRNKFHLNSQNFDIISIDIEGMDVEILEAILIEGHRPTFVSIEHNFVIQNEIAIRELAKNYGYRIICRKLSVQDYWLLNDL